MKKIFYYIACVLATSFTTTSCDDFFETNPDNVLNSEDYIEREAEMYRGFLGIITKMQEVGDHAMWLTEPRCNFLETTGNAPVALQNLNNYASTDGNEYADPTGYYSVVASCNDFIHKMEEFYIGIDGAISDSAKVHFPRLISSTLRLKTWAYYMLASIYGEAYWYDVNLTEVEDLGSATFERLDVKGICDRAIDLLDNGITVAGIHIPATLDMDWGRWVDPVNGNTAYDFWKQMTPPWLVLRAEFTSWRANYQSDPMLKKADYQWVRDNVSRFITDAILTRGFDYYTCTMHTVLRYSDIFYSEQVGYDQQMLGAIFYDYQNKQYNRLVQYLCPEWPGDGFYLKPSAYAQGKFSEADIRGPHQKLVTNILGGEECLTKFYYTRVNNQGYLRTKLFEIEPTIPLFRGHHLHFLLAEAENHLGHWHVAKTLLNKGILETFPGGYTTLPTDSLDGDLIWSTDYVEWFAASGGYGDIGIVGAARAEEYNLTTFEDYAATLPEGADMEQAKLDFAYSEERIKEYDMALADEYLKEFTGEGKSYTYLVKMAERYGDYRVIYDRVAGKYSADKQAQVENSLKEKYFIDWTLKTE